MRFTYIQYVTNNIVLHDNYGQEKYISATITEKLSDKLCNEILQDKFTTEETLALKFAVEHLKDNYIKSLAGMRICNNVILLCNNILDLFKAKIENMTLLYRDN